MNYDLDSLEGIESIKIPNYQTLRGMQSPTDNIEYILQRKATDHKKNGRMDLAIACLRKSNEIFPYSNFLWAKKDYMRLAEFLKQDGKFEEARIEEKRINDLFQENVSIFEIILQNCTSLKTDLVVSSEIIRSCSECAKYTRRIFSISGKDKRFPVLPTYFKLNLPEHEYCYISFYPFLLNLDQPNWQYKGDLISWSNRPFIDERTPEQKAEYEKWVRDNKQEIIDRENYDFLREKLSEFAPKSFGGFRRMKNIRSGKYLSLCKAALNRGINLDKVTDLSIYKF